MALASMPPFVDGFKAAERTPATGLSGEPGQGDGRPLSVAVISKADRSGGGASLVAEQLAELLLEAGHRVDHWVTYHDRSPKPFTRNLYGNHGRVIRLLHRLTGKLGLQEIVPWEYRVIRKALANYDVAHFHDISSTISPLTVRRVAETLPTAWTFHDCSPFTGGCLYPMGCEAFHTRCRRCPEIKTWPLSVGYYARLGFACDFTGTLQSVKRRTARRGLVTAISPSHWMADEAMKSGMFGTRPTVIPNAVDAHLYRPQDRRIVRDLLDLPTEAFVVLVSAHYVGDLRKGTHYAIEALNACDRPVHVLLIGHPDPAVLARLQVRGVTAPGYIANPKLLALYYAAADVFLFPTLADNLPTSILQTMACGTPTIGFRTGGVPDMVDHALNGWLAELGETGGLIAGLQFAFDHPRERQKWEEAGLGAVKRRFSPAQFLDSHLQTYRAMIGSRRAIRHKPGV